MIARFTLLLLVLLPSSADATIIWLSGVETGSVTLGTSEFSGSGAGSPTADTTIVHSGKYSLKVPSSAYVESQDGTTHLNLGLNTYYLRFYFYPTANPSSATDVYGGANSADTNRTVGMLINTNGTLCFTFNNGACIATSSHSVTLNAWNLIETKNVISATVGGMELKLNGTTEFTSFVTNTNTQGSTGRILWGPSQGGGVAYYYDDMILRDDQYPGAGLITARQGLAGTPTFDAWTKNSCSPSTAAGCWSDTPPSTSSNASTGTANAKQTMLVAPFNSTQTGHGPEALAACDAIQAVSVGYQGHGGGSQTIVSQILFNGVDQGLGNLSNWTASNQYRAIVIGAATLNQLDNMEIGGQCGAVCSETQTLNDLWVHVAYNADGCHVNHKARQGH